MVENVFDDLVNRVAAMNRDLKRQMLDKIGDQEIGIGGNLKLRRKTVDFSMLEDLIKIAGYFIGVACLDLHRLMDRMKKALLVDRQFKMHPIKLRVSERRKLIRVQCSRRQQQPLALGYGIPRIFDDDFDLALLNKIKLVARNDDIRILPRGREIGFASVLIRGCERIVNI